MSASLARRGDRPDLLAGLLFVAIGAFSYYAGFELRIGSAASMGPGYLPTLLSGLVVLIGLAVLLQALRRAPEPLDRVRLRPLAILLLSVAGFAVAVDTLGFVLAMVWLIGVASLADPESRWREIGLSILVLTAFGALVFILGLDVQMKLGPF